MITDGRDNAAAQSALEWLANIFQPYDKHDVHTGT
jgi:hypothetical protein